MRVKNYKEAEALVKKYMSITLKDIEDAWSDPDYRRWRTAQQLTGFGAMGSCTLCKGVSKYREDPRCNECVYGVQTGCIKDENRETWYYIFYANTPKKMLRAFRERGKHIAKILNKRRRTQINIEEM